ncbi:hypothetical protein KUW04_09145 [Halomonas denitrificans]|nr:hypothetical protein [Halomonas denitrificans]
MRIWMVALFGAMTALPVMARAPFGLQWGQSMAGMEQVEAGNPIGVLSIENPPKPHSRASSYWGFGTNESGLQKVVMNSIEIENDAFGTEGKALYASLVNALLGAGYQEENRLESVGNALWNEPDEFYQCLDYDGCGYWIWFGRDASGDTVMVKIEGVRRGQGRVRAIFESPKWNTLVEASQQQQAARDSDAF